MNSVPRTNPWIAYLLPFVVFMLVGSLEPSPPAASTADEMQNKSHLVEYRSDYLMVYAAKIALTLATMIYVWPGYRQHPWSLHFAAMVVGAIGAFVWIALAVWQHSWMPRLAELTGIDWFRTLGQRSGLN